MHAPRPIRQGCIFVATFLLLGLLAGDPAFAAVKASGIFADHMVVQRDKPLNVWGTGDNDEKVTVSIADQSAETTAKDGRWLVTLKPLKAGGPLTMTIAGSNKIELTDVLVGEVWICSGQSNMQMALSGCTDALKHIAEATHPNLRLCTVPRKGATEPQADVQAAWTECSPKTVGSFSAVAYFFGSALQPKLDPPESGRAIEKKMEVPIGLISSNVGGTPVERWASNANGEKSGDLYNAMIHPLTRFGIRGAIWYQGEANVSDAQHYRGLFSKMISNWRSDWQEGDFPFLFVQLAPYHKIVDKPGESKWAELCEAQLQTMLTVPNTAMAVITDVGDEDNIHPKRKQPVGERLALAARALAYGQKIEYSGPIYDGMSVNGNQAVLKFKHVGQGLEMKGDKLVGFTMAGEAATGAKPEFFPADAKIVGDTVVVTCEKVAKPAAVRFGWADYPVVNLWNKDGLPASPFRTDAPATEGKK